MTKRGYWGTKQKLKKAAAMQGNEHRTDAHFSDDLLKQFGDDPELKKWIQDNQKTLDSPNADGSLPFGEDHLEEHGRRKYLAGTGKSNNGEHSTQEATGN